MSQFSYEPMGPLDAPELAVSMALDGELTARGLRLAMFDPAGLSPAERETMAVKVKKRTGDNPFTNALTDIVMNPLTWFYFATSPTGMGALGTTSKLMFQSSKRLANFLKENGTWMQRLGTSTGLQATSEGASGSVLSAIARFVQGRRDIELQTLGPSHQAMLEANGIKRLDWRKISDPVQKDKAYKLSVALDGYLRGIDKEQIEFRSFVTPENFKKPPRITGLTKDDAVSWQQIGILPGGLGKTPKNSKVWIAAITHAPVTSQNMEEIVRSLGGEEAVNYGKALKSHLDEVKRMTWGRDDVKEFVPDPDKLLRAWRMAEDPAFQNAPATLQEGIGLMRAFMGPGRTGPHALGFDKWLELVTKAGFQPLESEGYLPKNIFETYKDGKSIQRFVDFKGLDRFHPASGSISRTRMAPVWHPDDLRTLEQLVGPSDKLAEMIGTADRHMQRSFKRGEGVRFLRMNPDAAVQKHTLSMNAAAALSDRITTDSGMSVLLANQEAINKGLYSKDGLLPGTKPLFGKTATGQELSMRESIQKHLADGNEPMGGFSMADALAADMVHMRNKYTLNRMADIYIPRVLGMNPKIAHTALYDQLLAMKETTYNLTNTSLFKKIESMGGYPATAVQKMRQWGESVNVPGEVGYTVGGLTKYLYATHLWGNAGLALLNITQPLGPTLTTYGVKHTAIGMWHAMNDLGRYITLRAEQGFRSLNELEAEAVKKQAFRLATTGPDGTDPIGIRTKVHEVLEGQFSNAGVTLAKQKSFYNRFIDAGLYLFQKTEWFNRLSTGYTHLSWAKEAGHLPADLDLGAANLTQRLRGHSTAIAEMSRSVQEFQFANDVLNLPDIFQPGQLLGNPLMRQFAGFVTRSTMIPFSLSPQLAGGVRFWRGTQKEIGLPPGLVDFGRILGASAVIYELGKNFIGSDLTRYTGYAQVTSGYPFLREGKVDPNEDGLPVVPPVIDIPMQGFKSLLTGDLELFKRQALRLVPGGVAAGKFAKYGWPGVTGLYSQLGVKEGDEQVQAFGSRIDPKTGLPGTPQADYRNITPDGRVPFYSPDGTLIDYRSPMQLILQGLGFPVKDTEVPQLDRFLTRNAEEIASYRQDAIDKMLSGDMAGYESVAEQFGRRFQFKGEDGQNRPLPLAISQSQIEARRKLHEQSRSDRIAGRIPSDIRAQYEGMVNAYDPYRNAEQATQSPAQQRREQSVGAETSSRAEERPFSGFGEFRGFSTKGQ